MSDSEHPLPATTEQPPKYDKLLNSSRVFTTAGVIFTILAFVILADVMLTGAGGYRTAILVPITGIAGAMMLGFGSALRVLRQIAIDVWHIRHCK